LTASRRATAQYCSGTCRQIVWRLNRWADEAVAREQIEQSCDYCAKPMPLFVRSKRRLRMKRSDAVYCSPTCRATAFKARRYAEWSGLVLMAR
jgi:hypothetical protein